MATLGTDPLTVGGTHDIRFTLTKDGAAFDVTGATITYAFQPPEGATPWTAAGTIVTAASGIVKYVTVAGATAALSDLDVEGDWEVSVTVEVGGLTLETGAIGFFVQPSLRLQAAA